MRKTLKRAGNITLISAFTSTLIFSMSACGHTHEWGAWNRAETEHWRVCKTCGKEEHEQHAADSKCSVCGAHFKALALGYNEGGDGAHSDFAREANEWFSQQAEELGFTYDFSTDFGKLNDETLAQYDLVILLNDKPSDTKQQDAFRRYMDNGGATMIFHSAAFAMWDNNTPPSEWEDWFHNTLLGSGEYGYGNDPEHPDILYWNTWNPTSEPLKVETYDHFATENLVLKNDEFMSSPCEWYAWHNDIMNDPNFTMLVTLNPTPENPAGDDPREGMEFQIWTTGHHPIAWSNNSYKMIYMNWGHNLQSYNNFEKESKTFSCPEICQFVIDGMYGLVTEE